MVWCSAPHLVSTSTAQYTPDRAHATREGSWCRSRGIPSNTRFNNQPRPRTRRGALVRETPFLFRLFQRGTQQEQHNTHTFSRRWN
jgi:hypothetical protein